MDFGTAIISAILDAVIFGVRIIFGLTKGAAAVAQARAEKEDEYNG